MRHTPTSIYIDTEFLKDKGFVLTRMYLANLRIHFSKEVCVCLFLWLWNENYCVIL